MKLTLATACAAFSLACAGAAAADTSVNATLQTPQAGHAQLIAAGAVFNCTAGACTAQVAPDDATSVSSCKDLARHVGPLASYTAGPKTLDATALARCNTAAAAPAAIGTASR